MGFFLQDSIAQLKFKEVGTKFHNCFENVFLKKKHFFHLKRILTSLISLPLHSSNHIMEIAPNYLFNTSVIRSIM